MDFNYKPSAGHHAFNASGLHTQNPAVSPAGIVLDKASKADTAALNRFSESAWTMRKTGEMARRIAERDRRNLIVINSENLPINEGPLSIADALKEYIKKQGISMTPDKAAQGIYLEDIANFIAANGPWCAYTPNKKEDARVLVSGYKGKDPYELLAFVTGARSIPQRFGNTDLRKLGVSPAIYNNDHLASFMTWHEGGHLEQDKYLIALPPDAPELDQVIHAHHKEAAADSFATIMTGANGDFDLPKDFAKLRTVFCLNMGPELTALGPQLDALGRGDLKKGWARYNNGRVIDHTASLMESIRDKKWDAVDHELMSAFKAYHNAKGEAPKEAHEKAFAEKEEILSKLKMTGLMGLREDEDTVHKMAAAMTLRYGMTEPELKATLAYAKALATPKIDGTAKDQIEESAALYKAEFGGKMTSEQKTYLKGLQKIHDDVLAPARAGATKDAVLSAIEDFKQTPGSEAAEISHGHGLTHNPHPGGAVPE